MLFNSYEFIFVFLPAVLVVFFSLGRLGFQSVAIAWLVAASLFFYGFWNPSYLGLIVGSALFNYGWGRRLSSLCEGEGRRTLALGIAINLALLGYFKYANFFVDNINSLFKTGIILPTIVLPLAISFFTFQQIAYLVDTFRHQTREHRFLHYCLFVTFFPQLIAGPIVHHGDMLPQFARSRIFRVDARNLAYGVAIFLIGLFKKVVIADGVARWSDPVFGAAAAGGAVSFVEAWQAAIAYTLQLYFDQRPTGVT